MNTADGHTTSAKVHCKFQESGMVNIDHTANHATLVLHRISSPLN